MCRDKTRYSGKRKRASDRNDVIGPASEPNNLASNPDEIINLESGNQGKPETEPNISKELTKIVPATEPKFDQDPNPGSGPDHEPDHEPDLAQGSGLTISMEKDDIDLIEELVRIADMGLLLGAPIHDNAQERIAEILTEFLAQV